QCSRSHPDLHSFPTRRSSDLPIVGQGGYGGAFGGIPLTAVCGLTLAIIWRRSIASLVADPIASLYDGGTTPPDPHPAYSIAQSRDRKSTRLNSSHDQISYAVF